MAPRGLVAAALVVAMVGLASANTVTPIILPPVKNASVEAALIIVPGAQIDGSAYQPIAAAIQESSPYQLWVAMLTGFFSDTPNILELPAGIDAALAELGNQGMESDNVFLAGHSLGGSVASVYGTRNLTQLRGVILFASYLSGVPLKEYPVPILHLSGDLDGLTRITRIAETFSEIKKGGAVLNMRSVFRTPVVVLPGMNHGQFASGTMPPNVRSNDITPEVTSEEAYDLAARHTSDFMVASLSPMGVSKLGARSRLLRAYQKTMRAVKPLLQVEEFSSNKFNVDVWGMIAQSAIANIKGRAMRVHSVLMKSSTMFMGGSPFINGSSVPSVTTFGRVTFPTNTFDVSTIPTSPEQISVKMKSYEAVMKFLGQNVTEGLADTLTCKMVNELALQTAERYASEEAVARYRARGRPIIFKEDDRCYTGLEWASKDLKLKETAVGLEVTSPCLKTAANALIAPGMHYCKLLSPARAEEWIYVDSLRPYHSPGAPFLG